MKQYMDLLNEVVTHGSWQPNRTNSRSISIPGAMVRYDLKDGFPLLTLRQMPIKSIIAEFIGFMRGYTDASQFEDLGCKFWTANATQTPGWVGGPYQDSPTSIGKMYGYQWRNFQAFKSVSISGADPKMGEKIKRMTSDGYTLIASGQDKSIYHKRIDQIANCLALLHKDPSSRRIVFHGWNPAEIEEGCLNPCHVLYQFICNSQTNELSICVYIRSNDLILGHPANVAEAAILLELFARLTGKTARFVTIQIGDAHIYESNLEVYEQMKNRPSYKLPKLEISDRIPVFNQTNVFEPQWLDLLETTDFGVVDYQFHPKIETQMVV